MIGEYSLKTPQGRSRLCAAVEEEASELVYIGITLLDEHEARFWVGYHIIDGKAQCLVPAWNVIPQEECEMLAKGLLGHNIKEFTNLNKVLPKVYAEEKNNW